MNRLQIRTRVRERLDDIQASYLWSDDELNFDIDRSIEEACLRENELIVDSDTASVCNLSVVVGTNIYAISDRILKIWRFKLPSVLKPLEQLGYKGLDDSVEQDWQVRDGAPSAFALDMRQRKLELSHNPIKAETAVLTVSRLPLADLVDDNAVPEIDEQYHYDLRDFVCYAALMKRDIDAHAADAALQHLASFERVFGKRKNHEMVLKHYPRRSKARFF